MIFWILVAVLLVVALIIVIVPLLKEEELDEISREQQNILMAKDKLSALKTQLNDKDITEEQFSLAKSDLENNLALDLENHKNLVTNHGGRWLIYVLAIVIPLTSVAMYWELGSQHLLDPKQKLADLQEEQRINNQNLEDMNVEDMVALVKKRLDKNPEDGEGWYILGRTFMNIHKYPEAVMAYKRSYELLGEEPNLLLSMADAVAMTQDGKMLGEPEQFVEQALAIDPNNPIGLWLGGLSAEQRNDIPGAYELWSRLLPLLANDDASYNEVKVMLLEMKEVFPELPALTLIQDDMTMLMVKLSINIDATIRAKLSGDEQVFVYAKAVSGPPMPLAAKKLKVSDLPIEITLSEADAMMPELTLATVDAFTVGARVSMSGNPIPQKGDYFMEVSPLTRDSIAELINLQISKVVE